MPRSLDLTRCSCLPADYRWIEAHRASPSKPREAAGLWEGGASIWECLSAATHVVRNAQYQLPGVASVEAALDAMPSRHASVLRGASNANAMSAASLWTAAAQATRLVMQVDAGVPGEFALWPDIGVQGLAVWPAYVDLWIPDCAE